MSWTSSTAPLRIPDGPLVEDELPVAPPSADVEQAWAFAREIGDSLSEVQEGLFSDLLHPRNREGEWVDGLRRDMHDVGLPPAEAEKLGHALAQSFNGFTSGGITAVLTPRTSFKGHHADIWLNFNLAGNPVGFGRFTLLPPDRDGKRSVKLENLFLKPDYQDRGFGTALTSHVFAMLKALRVDTMKLEAVQVGSYTWARAGFVWTKDPVKEQQRLYREATQSEAWREIAEHVSEALRINLARKVAAGEFSSEAELAAFGREEPWTDAGGHTTWLGKALLLDGRWEGERAP